ncbi:protein CURVATURE THYLAKOID 1A, chloroplastic-like isoform X1 [Salvia miltiorrhiza]|uniref:protein CURVATURE THYLAKOID 1A, chloroplastic-like isoform X1 n=1 Tax=Salvia miltiorrhiza TaxID=226208 RepID=UPI0025AD5CDE|nr:protein CURVATURE THYLAKOID 1A, chloroplastic-like isoform X1 [Salvia miltiorrhiza]
MAAAASTSMAATAVLLHRLPAARPAAVFCPLPQRPTLSATPFKLLKESRRSSQLLVKATSSEESSLDTTELFNDLKGKWDAVENKTTVILYGGASIVAIWLASTVVGAVNSVPLVGFSSCSSLKPSVFLFVDIANEYSSSSASQDHGVGRAWIHRLVCVPLPALQGTPPKRSILICILW